MPYIHQNNREELLFRPARTPGELNYLFTLAARSYIDAQGMSYQTINDILGALDGCKLEFYRRIAVPYEEQKRAFNGDVW